MSQHNHFSEFERALLDLFLPEGAWIGLREWVNKAIIGLINSIFVRVKITTDGDLLYPHTTFPKHMDHKSVNKEN